MTNTATQELILSKLSEYGTLVAIILGAVILVGLAYLVFRFGWREIKLVLAGKREMVFRSRSHGGIATRAKIDF